jgi:hypothetical protein
MVVKPNDPTQPAPLPRIYKKSRGHTDRDALLDVRLPIGESNQIVPIMLDEGAVTPETTIQSVYDRNYAFALAKRYTEALGDIRALANEYGTTIGSILDPDAGLEQNLAALRERIGISVPTTDPLLLTPYAKLSTIELQAAADARVATLQVSTSLRYDNQGGARYACNCYAADYLQFHPDKPFLPRIWWTREGKKKLAEGITAFVPGDWYALNSNDLNRWFRNSSKRFGWVHIADNDVDAAQAAANLGHAVVASAQGLTEAGHIVNFAPEDPRHGNVAHRRDGKIVENGFVRSQAGAVNVGRAVSYTSTNVFDANHDHAGIWRYDPTLDESLGRSTVEVGGS